jgi:hypothetical protein
MHKYALRLFLLFAVLGVAVASADTLQNCASCGGVVYTLTAAADSHGLGANWYDFTLIVNTTHIAAGSRVLNAVAMKDPSATGATLLSVSAGTWNMIQGGTNNGGTSGTGCVTNTKNGWDCAQATSASGIGAAKGVPTGAGDIYTFVFAFLLPAGSSGDLAAGVGLKAYYDTAAGTFSGLQTSDTFSSAASPVPEPGTLTLLGAGLAVAGLIALKRR